jgi:deoxyribonuclease V
LGQKTSEVPDLDELTPSEPFLFEKAVTIQKRFSHLVRRRSGLPRRILLVAGVDVAYSDDLSFAASVLVDYKDLKPIESQYAESHVKVPYRPGFLGFREAPIMTETVRRLSRKPDVVLVDGHGLVHPRRFGLACHVGVLLNIPTIGVAKNAFFGKVRGDRILDKDRREIGATIKVGKKILYVSIGHRVSLNAAIRIAKHCLAAKEVGPLRLSHEEATTMARKMRT